MIFFFFNDTTTTEIYTLSLHDALPISRGEVTVAGAPAWRNPEVYRQLGLVSEREAVHGFLTAREFVVASARLHRLPDPARADRKSTRLNSSHANISYAVFCLKKKMIVLLCTFSLSLYNSLISINEIIILSPKFTLLTSTHSRITFDDFDFTTTLPYDCSSTLL